MEPSRTAYDDSFHTLLNDCPELVIPVVNEAFGENYTGEEEVIFAPNEHYTSQDDGTIEKRITDSCFRIIRSDGGQKNYHIECETDLRNTILIRLFEYDTRIALSGADMEEHVLTVSFPHSAIMALRNTTVPDTMRLKVVTPGGDVVYDVPVIKVQKYSLEEIFQRKLLFFLPFYIFNHEKQFPEYESDEAKLKKLTDEYRYISEKLELLQIAGEIDSFTIRVICATMTHVLELIAQKYKHVREGVGHTMKWKIIEYEAKDILRRGRNEGYKNGFDEGRNEGRDEERKLAMAETEARARDMLRDRMDISLVEKYTHLSLPRIRELARGLGVL